MASSINISGQWYARYWYPSNDTDGEHQTPSSYVVQTNEETDKEFRLFGTDGSATMLISLRHVYDQYYAGSWEENSQPDGDFKGARYMGVVWLLASDDGQTLSGMWSGDGRIIERDDAAMAGQAGVFTGRMILSRQRPDDFPGNS